MEEFNERLVYVAVVELRVDGLKLPKQIDRVGELPVRNDITDIRLNARWDRLRGR